MSPEGSPCGLVSNFRWESGSRRQLAGKCVALSWPMSPALCGTATGLAGHVGLAGPLLGSGRVLQRVPPGGSQGIAPQHWGAIPYLSKAGHGSVLCHRLLDGSLCPSPNQEVRRISSDLEPALSLGLL